jgi:phosphoribosylformimino-5-aminoimidazole carboxamide ribonucleotide (ProFAR) isomerase
MIIYPDLELRKGRLVNLVRNRIDSPLIYDLDPVQAAGDLAAQGAEWLHVVDLDAVFNDGENTAISTRLSRRPAVWCRSAALFDQWKNCMGGWKLVQAESSSQRRP